MCIVLPPARIGARGQKAHNERAPRGFLEGFPDPQADAPAIGRIDEDLAFPWLQKAVLFACNEGFALGVLSSRARTEREAAVEGGGGGGEMMPVLRSNSALRLSISC